LLWPTFGMHQYTADLANRMARAGWELWWVPQARVKHHGEGSSKQVDETMYIQLYRSKIQFCRKFGGSQCAHRLKRLLRLAYGPHVAIVALGASVSSALAAQARMYHLLLAELPAV
jgi:GT2 family glycosyltransferase